MVAYRQVKRATHWKQLVAFGHWPNYAATFWLHVPAARFNIEYRARRIDTNNHFSIESSRPTPADLSDVVSREDRFFRRIWRRRKREKIGGQIVEMGTIGKFNLFGRGWRRVKLEGGESLLGGEFVVVDSLGYFERKRRRGKASFIELRTFNIEPAAFIFGHALGNRRKIHSAYGSWFRRKNREIINLPEGLIVSRTKLPLVLFPRFLSSISFILAIFRE